MLIIKGTSFYKLAQTYNKNKVLYVLMGLGIAFAVQLITGAIWGLYELKKGIVADTNNIFVNLTAGIISAFAVYFFYLNLKKKNENNPDNIVNQIDDIGKINNEENIN